MINNKIYNLDSYITEINLPDISQDLHRMKKRVLTYRAIFLGLGLIFSIVGGVLIFKISHWRFMPFFGFGLSAKWLISLFTSTCAIASLWIGCHLRIDQELIKSYFQSSRKRISRSFQRKKTPFHLNILLWKEEAHKETKLRLLFEETLEILRHNCEEAEHQIDLLNHKREKESFKTREKEQLLASLKANLETLVESFEANS